MLSFIKWVPSTAFFILPITLLDRLLLNTNIQMRKLRLEEVKSLAQVHEASE